jgi:signal transduction histidine kinase
MARDDNVQWLTKLAGGLVHEIKNPLSTLNLNLQLLKEDWSHAEGPQVPRSLRKLEILLKEVKRLESILNDFLRYVKGFQPHLVEVDVNEIVSEVLEFLAPDLEKENIRVWESQASNLPRTMADRDLLKQAVMNIVLNAKQAMSGGGELMVRTLKSKAGIILEITDTGPGLPADRKEKIFDAYFSTRKDGTGLGLTMTRDIVEAHGGSIFVESEEGKGSRFTIGMPVRRTPAPVLTE